MGPKRSSWSSGITRGGPMPFKSQAQRAFMYSQHPAIAKRWEAITPKDHGLPKRLGKNPNPKSESHETWKKGEERVARKPANLRDFGHLTPSSSARFSPKSKSAPSEREAMI